MKKIDELREGTIARAADDEPVFVLRAKDETAPTIVRLWAGVAELVGAPHEKTVEARAYANEMERWQNANGCKTPD